MTPPNVLTLTSELHLGQTARQTEEYIFSPIGRTVDLADGHGDFLLASAVTVEVGAIHYGVKDPSVGNALSHAFRVLPSGAGSETAEDELEPRSDLSLAILESLDRPLDQETEFLIRMFGKDVFSKFVFTMKQGQESAPLGLLVAHEDEKVTSYIFHTPDLPAAVESAAWDENDRYIRADYPAPKNNKRLREIIHARIEAHRVRGDNVRDRVRASVPSLIEELVVAHAAIP